MENSRERKEIVRGKWRRRGKARGGERWKRAAEEEEEEEQGQEKKKKKRGRVGAKA